MRVPPMQKVPIKTCESCKNFEPVPNKLKHPFCKLTEQLESKDSLACYYYDKKGDKDKI